MSKETGGPAFPVETKLNRVNNEAWQYQTKDGDIFQFPGLTVRDYFAAKAMQGMMSSSVMMDNVTDSSVDWAAKGAYKMADAMLEARKS